MNEGDTETLKESISRPKGYLCTISDISEVSNFMSRHAWIIIKRSKLKAKGGNPLPVKWSLKNKEEPDKIIRLKSRNVFKGYMQVQGFHYTD